MGIDSDPPTQIFIHGFTTKIDGHGFGLYDSANAVSEIGATLVVESERLGQGATFWFEFASEVL